MPENYANHPRTLLLKSELAEFRNKVKREPFAHMLRLSVETAEKRRADSDWLTDGRLARVYAEIYLAGGDALYAEYAWRALTVFMEDRQGILSNRMAKGLTRALYLFNLAQTYDFCAAAWDDEQCAEANSLLYRLTYELSASMGDGGNYNLANNWNGVRAGAIIYAAYACDTDDVKYLLWESRTRLKDHIAANLSEEGWNPEGIGYVTYPWIYMTPAVVAARKNGADYLKDIPKARLAYLKALFGVVPIEGDAGCYGIHCDLSDDNTEFASRGTLAGAFEIVPEEYRPAVKWMFDRLRGDEGDGSWDGGDYGLINSMLFYPDGVTAKNPAELLGLCCADREQGVLVMRNRFRDERDIVALCCSGSRRPKGTHSGRDTGAVRLIGFGSVWITGSGRTGDPDGQSTLFPGGAKTDTPNAPGKTLGYSMSHDGSGWAFMYGSSVGTAEHYRGFAADYSGTSGAEALFVLSDKSADGRRWRINTLEMNTIAVDTDGFTITAPNGASLKAALLGLPDDSLKNARLGSFERGRAGEAAVILKRNKYLYNNWIEYEVDGGVTAVMTLADAGGVHPSCHFSDGTIYIGEQTVRIKENGFIFGK